LVGIFQFLIALQLILSVIGKVFLMEFALIKSHGNLLNRLLFYYPFTALAILFSHVITNPLAPTASNDIALMDVVTGLFGRLDFVSSGMRSLTEVGEFARLARAAVKRARTHLDRRSAQKSSDNEAIASRLNQPSEPSDNCMQLDMGPAITADTTANLDTSSSHGLTSVSGARVSTPITESQRESFVTPWSDLGFTPAAYASDVPGLDWNALETDSWFDTGAVFPEMALNMD
jgi:hypothetical protein